MRITLQQYNFNWKNQFNEMKRELENVLSEVEIEHIGSTSVEKLMAKAIIDILIGAKKSEKLDNFVSPIQNLGFKYISEYEKNLPNRRFFIKEENGNITHHIHLVHSNTNWFKRHIAFRNELRINSKTRDEYQNLKLKLSNKDWESGNDYADEKTEFIRSVENRILNENTEIYK